MSFQDSSDERQRLHLDQRQNHPAVSGAHLHRPEGEWGSNIPLVVSKGHQRQTDGHELELLVVFWPSGTVWWWWWWWTRDNFCLHAQSPFDDDTTFTKTGKNKRDLNLHKTYLVSFKTSKFRGSGKRRIMLIHAGVNAPSHPLWHARTWQLTRLLKLLWKRRAVMRHVYSRQFSLQIRFEIASTAELIKSRELNHAQEPNFSFYSW